MTNEHKMVIVLAASVSFLVCSIMFTWSRTLMRSADDVVKIKQAETPVESAADCAKNGGRPQYNYDNYTVCKYGSEE